MVGLSEVKKVTDEILAAAKMQKMRKQMGLPGVQSSMHMLFSGNPGTAKTTVARLLSQVFEGRGSAEIWPHCRVRQAGSGRKVRRLDSTDC